MKRSTDRILTTHAGSLPRPPDILQMIRAKARGEPVDEKKLGRAGQGGGDRGRAAAGRRRPRRDRRRRIRQAELRHLCARPSRRPRGPRRAPERVAVVARGGELSGLLQGPGKRLAARPAGADGLHVAADLQGPGRAQGRARQSQSRAEGHRRRRRVRAVHLAGQHRGLERKQILRDQRRISVRHRRRDERRIPDHRRCRIPGAGR